MMGTIILGTLVQIFATQPPNLCADVYLDPSGAAYTDSLGQTLSRYCRWTGPDAPVWDGDVCCTIDGDGAHCSVPDVNGRCAVGLRMYCEYGVAEGGGVTCLQPFPSACEAGFCVEAPAGASGGQEDLACCSSGATCQTIGPDSIPDCEANGGELLWCFNGTTNEDGTMDCWDCPAVCGD